jgi:hypothetical protein
LAACLYTVGVTIKAVIEQTRQDRESGDIREDRGGYQGKEIETVDHLADRIFEWVKNQNEY